MGMPAPPAPPLGPSAPTLTCPSCGASADPSNRFCPKCGASLTAPPPPPPPPPPPSAGGPSAPGAPPVDIRTQVDQDRGMLKRLQLLIPGFRGYRQGEDIREADSMLRMQVADKVHQSVDAVQRYRQGLAQAGQFQAINDVAQVLSELQMLEGRIRQAEQGYSGIAPAIRVNPSTLDQLYQYDYGFVAAADTLYQTVSPLGDAAGPSGNGASVATTVQTVRGQVQQLNAAFQARLRAVEGIQV